MSERVKHPKHYNKGIEMWDYAHSHNLDFFEGNIVKYVTRWKEKNGVEALHKAKQYQRLYPFLPQQHNLLPCSSPLNHQHKLKYET